MPGAEVLPLTGQSVAAISQLLAKHLLYKTTIPSTGGNQQWITRTDISLYKTYSAWDKTRHSLEKEKQ